MFIEEFDTTQDDGAGGSGPLPDISVVQEVVAEFLLCDLIRGLSVMHCELPYRSDIGILRPLGHPAQLHVLDHAFT